MMSFVPLYTREAKSLKCSAIRRIVQSILDKERHEKTGKMYSLKDIPEEMKDDKKIFEYLIKTKNDVNKALFLAMYNLYRMQGKSLFLDPSTGRLAQKSYGLQEATLFSYYSPRMEADAVTFLSQQCQATPYDEYKKLIRFIALYNNLNEALSWICLRPSLRSLFDEDIHTTINLSKAQIIELLLLAGANPNYIDERGESLLMNLFYLEAVANNSPGYRERGLLPPTRPDIESIKVLLAAGADPNFVDRKGETLYRLAGKHPDILQLLIDYKSTNAVNNPTQAENKPTQVDDIVDSNELKKSKQAAEKAQHGQSRFQPLWNKIRAAGLLWERIWKGDSQ